MTRKAVLLVCALAAFLGAAVAALATIQQRDFDLRGYVDATQTQNLPFRAPILGVNAELMQYPAGTLATQFSLMTEANITWVRQFARWDEIELAPGEYHWEQWDTLINALVDFPHLQLVVVLSNTPEWARGSIESEAVTTPPSDPNLFAGFAREFAGRYGHVVHYYQIWDEPNIRLGWGMRNPQVSGYAALLQATYLAIHGADANATVIAAALAPTIETGPQNISDWHYLRDLYAYGAADFADAFAAKPYGFDFSPYDRRVEANLLNFSRMVALREIMIENGDGKKALWGSDYGWNALPEGWDGTPSIWGSVTPVGQMQFVLDSLARTEREWPWAGGMILQHWQPDKPKDDPRWGFTIIGQDGKPGMLWETLKNRPLESGASNGLFPPQNPYACYSGTWTFGDFGADVGWTQDSRLEFDFTGTDIALLVREGDYVAYFYPTIDGHKVNQLPDDTAGNAYLHLRSSTLRPQLSLIPISRGLPEETHTLRLFAYELKPDESAHRWPLVGFAISSGDLRAPYTRQITIAWITTVITGIAVGVLAWQIQPGYHHVRRWLRPLWARLGNLGQIFAGFMTSWAMLIGMLITWDMQTPVLFRRDSVQLGLSMLTAGLIYINEAGIIVAIVAGILLGVMIYNRLELGVLLVIFWSPFFLAPVELYQFAFPIVEVVLLITVAAWGLRMLVAWGETRQTTLPAYPGVSLSQHVQRLSPIDMTIIAWVLLGTVSLLWTQRRDIAITELRTLIVQPALFYLVLRTIPQNRQSLTRLVRTLILAGVAISLIGLWMWLRGEGIITAEGGARRLASVYGSPNNVGLFLGRCIPFTLAFFLIVKGKPRFLAGAALLAMLPAALLSQSAGALFIGIPAAVLGVLVLTFRKRAVVPLLILCMIMLVGVIFAAQMPRFNRIFDFSSGTNFYRLRVWQSATQLIADRPFTGSGLDQFLYEYRGKYILPDAWEEPDLSHPHNFLLDFWARLGLLGVVLFGVMQGVFWRKVYRLYRRYYHDPSNALSLVIAIGTMGAMLNLLAHGLVDNSVYVLDLAYVFMLILGLPVLLDTSK